MEPEKVTFTTPVGFVLTAILGLLILILPRKYAAFPMVAEACYIPMGQTMVLRGFNFYMIRIIILLGWLRLMVRGELLSVTLNKIDKIL